MGWYNFTSRIISRWYSWPLKAVAFCLLLIGLRHVSPNSFSQNCPLFSGYYWVGSCNTRVLVDTKNHNRVITPQISMILYIKLTISFSLVSPFLKDKSSDFESEVRRIYKPHIQNITTPFVAGRSTYDVLNAEPPRWTPSLGEQICIVDVDTRSMNEKHQIWADHNSFEWSQTDHNSYGYVNHYFYCMCIHTHPIY